MKRPNLTYNHYFPFYTQKVSGEKKYYYDIQTVVHLSDNNGVLIRLGYKQKKIYEVSVERISEQTKLYDYRMNDNYISYVAFAKEVEKLYRTLSRALGALSNESAYVRTLIFSSYFKHNSSIVLKMGYRNIQVIFEEHDYIIENGKKVMEKKSSNNTNSEEDMMMKKLSDAVDVINAQTTYKEIDAKDFDKEFNYTWERFIQYFESPKFIRKSEYEPR